MSIAKPGLAGAYVALAFTLLFWAAAFPATRHALESLTPEALMALRFSLASLLLGAWAATRHIGLPRREDAARILFIGVISGFLYQIAFNYGMKSVQSGPASVLLDTAPIFAALGGVLLLRERPGLPGWLGIAIGFAGVVVIALAGHETPESGLRLEEGALYLLAAAVLFAANAVLQKPLLARYSVVSVSVWVFVGGTLPMLVFLPEGLAALPGAPAGVLWSVAFLAAFPAAIAFVLWSHALAVLSVAAVASSLYLLPPFTFVIAWLWLGEVPTMVELAGAAITLAGVAMVQIPQLRRG